MFNKYISIIVVLPIATKHKKNGNQCLTLDT